MSKSGANGCKQIRREILVVASFKSFAVSVERLQHLLDCFCRQGSVVPKRPQETANEPSIEYPQVRNAAGEGFAIVHVIGISSAPLAGEGVMTQPTAAQGHMPFKGHRTCAHWSNAPAGYPIVYDHQQSGTVAVPPRNRRLVKARVTKCSACCDYTNKPCKWALCPQRERA